MKNPFKKLFSKHKEEPILVYTNNEPWLCDSLELTKDKDGIIYLTVIAGYDLSTKKWIFFTKHPKIEINDCKVRYMDHNILKTLDIK